VGRAGQLGERRGELERTFLEAHLRQPVAIVQALDVTLGDQPVEVLDADVGVDAEEPLQQPRIDLVTEALAPEPVHDLEDLAPPVQLLERFGLRGMHDLGHR
jgi:hypothetical protein